MHARSRGGLRTHRPPPPITVRARASTPLPPGRAGRIVVIGDGKLVESGTHLGLLAIDGGVYRHLYELQLEMHTPRGELTPIPGGAAEEGVRT